MDDSLQNGIVRRQQELHDVAEFIARKGHSYSAISRTLKLITITLGAVAAAKGTADTLLGSQSHLSLLIFTLIGISISICAGIETAFKYEARGSELTLLASKCQAIVRQVDSDWRKKIGSSHSADVSEEARELITFADDNLAKAQSEAAQLGVNVTLRVYELTGQEYRDAVAA